MSPSRSGRAPRRRTNDEPLALEALEGLPVGVLRVRGSRIAYANPAAAALFGESPESLVGAGMSELIEMVDPAERDRVKDRHFARQRGERLPDFYELTLRLAGREPRRVEMEFRSLAPDDLVILLHDVTSRLKESALLAALSETAMHVQRAGSVDEVLATAGTRLRALGLHFGAARLDGDQLVFLRVDTDPALLADGEALLGRPLVGLAIPARADLSEPDEPRATYLDDFVTPFVEDLGRALPAVDLSGLANRLHASLGRGVVAPLWVHGKPWGVIGVASATFGSADAAALTLFAAQLSSALEVAKSMAALERGNLDLAAVHAIAATTAEHDLDRLVAELLAIACEATSSNSAALYLLDARGRDLVLRGARGVSGPLIEAHARLPVEGTVSGRGLEGLAPSSLGVDRDWPEPSRSEAIASGVREAAIVPLQHQGRPVGLLYLGRPGVQAFGEADLSTAGLLGGQIAIQLENALLHTDEQRRLQQLSTLSTLGRLGTGALEVTPLAAAMLVQLTEAVAATAGVLYLVREDRITMAAEHGLGEPGEGAPPTLLAESACGQAAHELRIVSGVAPSTGGPALAWVAAPLVAKERLVGTFWLSRVSRRPFLEEELGLLESCAAQVGVAIEHARLFEDERRRVRDLSLINELGQLLGQHLDLSAVLSMGVRQLSQIIDVPDAFLALVSEDGRRWRHVASTLADPAALDVSMPLDRPSAVSTAIAGRRPVIVYDAPNDPRTANDAALRFGHRSILAVPLLARGEAIGAMVLGEHRPERRFSDAAVALATTVANQLATAIANARLYEREHRRVEDLKTLLDVGRLIAASLDLEEILEVSAASIARLADATHSFIWLLDPASGKLKGVACSDVERREHFRTQRLALDDRSAAAHVVRTRAPVRIRDARHSDLTISALVDHYGIRSLLALPLLVRDEAMGAVVVCDCERERDWTDAQLERATGVARQVAIGVANARLYEDLKESYDDLSRAQEELVRRERLAALGELAAIVAHEVRNPLGVIFNSLGSLKRSGAVSGDAAMLLDIVGEEAERLNRIVGDLLDFARPKEPLLQPEPLASLVAGAVEATAAAAAASRVEVAIEAPQGLPPVPVDARLFRQALVNLLINAIQAMPQGGRATVEISREERAGAPWAAVAISDTGPGVPPDLAERIFQPFFTTKASGTGLGLAVVKRIAEVHRGDVAVGVRPGGGAVFTLRVPEEPREPDGARGQALTPRARSPS